MSEKWVHDMGSAVQKLDHWEMITMRPEYNPVEVAWAYCPEERLRLFGIMAKLVGVALVYDGTYEIRVVGTRAGLAIFERYRHNFKKERWREHAVEDALYSAASRYAAPYDEAWVKMRFKRVNQLGVFHRIVEINPDFRDWTAPSPPEVTLIPRVGEWYLDGIALNELPAEWNGYRRWQEKYREFTTIEYLSPEPLPTGGQ